MIEKFKKFAYFTQLLSLVFIVLLLTISYQINNYQDDIKKAQDNAQHSIELAYELFQSSENLTRMARSYTVTGNPIHKETFMKVIDMRNGNRKRPPNYSPTYWYIQSNEDTHTIPNIQLSGPSLRSTMIEANFTSEEITLLDKSQKASDELALIEQEAFRIVENSAMEGGVVNIKTPQAEEAVKLLYDDTYALAKNKIMLPINQVISSVKQRNSIKINRLRSEIQIYIYVLWTLIFCGFVGIAIIFLYTTNRFISPLSQLSDTDTLTGILNRRGFKYLANREFARSQRTKHPFSLAMIDIDHFKNINDLYGHSAGDTVLIRLSKLLQDHLRNTDILGRWGGEEFLILSPESEGADIFNKADKIRGLIENHIFLIDKELTLRITASIGLTIYNENIKNLDTMIDKADKQLYLAKESGRNKVCISCS